MNLRVLLRLRSIDADVLQSSTQVSQVISITLCERFHHKPTDKICWSAQTY